MVKVASRFLIYAKSSPFAWRVMRSLGVSTHGVRASPSSDICVEGFESSANSYAFNVIRHLAPDLSISHHCHTAANVKLALRYSVPTVVLFRDPKDAIPSLVTRFRPNLYEAVVAYGSFYKKIENISEDVLLVSFDDITNDLDHFIRRLRSLDDVRIDEVKDVTVLDRQVKEKIRKWQKENKDPYTTPLPTEERKAKKDALRQKLLQMKEFETVQETYEKICRRYELQEKGYEMKRK